MLRLVGREATRLSKLLLKPFRRYILRTIFTVLLLYLLRRWRLSFNIGKQFSVTVLEIRVVKDLGRSLPSVFLVEFIHVELANKCTDVGHFEVLWQYLLLECYGVNDSETTVLIRGVPVH